MEYENIVVRADQEMDSKIRIMLVAAFGAAQYACSVHRTSKPFNPILGETYEFVCPQYRYIGEQVSHHPPISAAYANSDHYEFQMQTHTKMGLSWGSLKAVPIGL